MDPSERMLGELALRHSLLTREQVIDSARRAHAEGGQRNLAEVARDMGWLSPQDAEALIRKRDQLLNQRRTVPNGTPQAEPSAAIATIRMNAAAQAAPVQITPAQTAPVQTPRAPDAAPQRAEAAAPVEPATARNAQPPAPAVLAPHSRRVPPRAVVASRPVGEPHVDDTSKPPYLARALRFAIQHGASDLHFHCGMALIARSAGKLLPFQGHKALSMEAVEKAIAQILTDEQWEKLAIDGEIDFPLDLPNVGRFRANAYRQHRGTDAVFRVLPAEPPQLEALGLPASLSRLVDYRTGMVLCTGPAGSGKSTTLSALLGLITGSRKEHVLTIENPIEIVYRNTQSVVTQRGVGPHTNSFARALRAALREDPDVIAITELRDRETMGLAMTAAETGHLVFGTLNTGNAAQTIGRIINSFPANEQSQVRATLSESLRAIVSQRLVPRADGNGRVVAVEVLIVNVAVSNLIREEKEYQVGAIMQTGKSLGMITLDDALIELLNAGTIDKASAKRFAENKERFK
jgi:twitching motility protein PilT